MAVIFVVLLAVGDRMLCSLRSNIPRAQPETRNPMILCFPDAPPFLSLSLSLSLSSSPSPLCVFRLFVHRRMQGIGAAGRHVYSLSSRATLKFSPDS